jgi:hypothetical protein
MNFMVVERFISCREYFVKGIGDIEVENVGMSNVK